VCIAFPGKVLSIDEDHFAVIDISGTRREVSSTSSTSPSR